MRYSEGFVKQHFPGPYPTAHTIEGDENRRLPPDGDAVPERGDVCYGLSYPGGQDFGPYVQRLAQPNQRLDDMMDATGIPYSAGNAHAHSAMMLFSLELNCAPEVIVETGTFYGYTTWYLAQACLFQGFGKVYTIDPEPKLIPDKVRNHPNVEVITGKSQEVLPGLLKKLGEVQVAFLDAYKRQCLQEITIVNDFIPEGGLIITHDTAMLNTGETLANIAYSLSNYDTMLFAGRPHKDDPHKFFGNADDRGLMVLRKRETDPFLGAEPVRL